MSNFPQMVSTKDNNKISGVELECTFSCYSCKETVLVCVSEAGYNFWSQGAFTQDAFPDLSAGDREMFISGVCGKCWSNL